MKSWEETVRAVRNKMENEGCFDAGDGAEIRLGCTRAMLDAVVLHMILKGCRYGVEEAEKDGVKTRTYVLRKGEVK